MSSRPPISKIRILHTSAAIPQADILNQLNDSHKQFSERIAALKTYQSSQKNRQQNNSRKTEWTDEHHRLMKLRNRLEQDCNSGQRELLVNHVELATALHRSMAEEDEYTDKRRQRRQFYRQQLKDIEKMIAQHVEHLQPPQQQSGAATDNKRAGSGGKFRKSFSQHSTSGKMQTATTNDQIATENSASSSSSSKPSADVIKAVLAEFFLELRHNQAQQWQVLKQEETTLERDVNAIHKHFQSIIQQETLAKQDETLQSSIIQLLHDANINLSTFTTTGGGLGEAGNNDDLPASSGNSGQSVITDELMAIMDEIAMEDMELSQLLQSYLTKLSILDAEYQQQQQEKHEVQEKLCLELGVDVTLPYGGWEKDVHDTFVKIYRKAQVSGMLRKKMMDTMVAQLPAFVSMDDILLHEEWYRKMKLLQTKHKESELGYTTRRKDLMLTIVEELKRYQQQKQERIQYEQELLHHEVHRQLIHDKLEELRHHRQLREEEQKLAELAKQQLDDATLQAKQAELERERDEQRRKLAQYHEEKRQRDALERAKRDAEAKAAAELLKKLVEENKSKVELRAAKYAEKLQQRKQHEEELLMEEERKIAMLQKLAEQVPYFDTISNIETRYDQATASTVGHQFVENEEEATRGHIPLYGFADQRIIRDTRFRLAEALRSAGLAQSSAARDLVQRMNPRPHLAIHGLL
jgi:hypothetical protein